MKELNYNDIFLLISLWEGLPISLLEAMYMKKICIVSDVIGNKDVIENGRNGYIVKNAKDCMNVINTIMKNKKNENIQQEEWKDIQKIYNMKRMVEQYNEEYGE